MTRALMFIVAALAVLLVALLWSNDSLTSRAEQAEDQVGTLTKALASRKQTQAILLDIDTKHTQELADARKDNEQLRADVATGRRRLSVAARCPVVRTTGAAGVDDGETRADIDPAAAERIVAIANDGDDAIRQLTALQEYVSKVCLQSGAE